MKTIIFSVVILFSLLGCSSTFIKNENLPPPAEGVDYEFSVRANYELQRFELELQSLTDKLMYISDHNWPNKLGQIHFAGEDVYVLVNGAKFYYQEQRNFGYCFPACSTRIEPKESLKGFVLFSEFSDEAFLEENAERSLVFKVSPSFLCGKTRSCS